MSDSQITGSELVSTEQSLPMVVRQTVPPNLPYNDYREYLRQDFIYACAYCTMMEYEASTIRFTIDHYVPQGQPGVAVHQYDNLIYCCDECNRLKGNRYPPPDAQSKGIRFFRPDRDVFDEHFALSGVRIEGLTSTGTFTVDFLSLNRQSLRRLRDYRERVTTCHQEAAELVVQLGQIRIDRLPKHLRARAVSAVKRAREAANDRTQELQSLLEEMARSPNGDKDPDAAALSGERSSKLKTLKALYPGQWSVPRH